MNLQTALAAGPLSLGWLQVALLRHLALRLLFGGLPLHDVRTTSELLKPVLRTDLSTG